MSKHITKIAVIGAGAWGTALACAFTRAGLDVTLWAREEEVARQVNSLHQNATYLPDAHLPPEIYATSDMAELRDAQVLFVVTPVQYTRAFYEQLQQSGIAGDVPLILCHKGIETCSSMLPTDIAQEFFAHNPLLVLSGPSFAIEVARAQPTAVNLAGDIALARAIAEDISSNDFHIVAIEDAIGAQIAGAAKNVLAIACGIFAGKNFGENAKAMLLTRGLGEISALSRAMGGREETAHTLCGVGDLTLTCASQKSRNMSLGFALGQGRSMVEITSSRSSVAEGVATAKAVEQLRARYDLRLPICEAVYKITSGDRRVTEEDCRSFFFS